ncbi:hypothetical protein [Micromonospora sp. IBHARD004]|uniref:hypothetical protein n=1 Tax=Micromonospora sp. IBHARD004 TaxID=3457764 RepID=UPI00405987F2
MTVAKHFLASGGGPGRVATATRKHTALAVVRSQGLGRFPVVLKQLRELPASLDRPVRGHHCVATPIDLVLGQRHLNHRVGLMTVSFQ